MSAHRRIAGAPAGTTAASAIPAAPCPDRPAPALVQRSLRDAPTASRCETRDGRASGHPQSVLPGWSRAGRAADARPVTATSLPQTTTVRRPTEGRSAGRGFLAALDDRRLALAAVGPNWFASVMGTSIVATGAGGPPRGRPGVGGFGGGG